MWLSTRVEKMRSGTPQAYCIVQNEESDSTPSVSNSTKRPLNFWTISNKKWPQCGRLLELGKRAQQLCAQSAKLLKLPPLSFVLTPDSSAPHIVFFQEKVSLISDYYYILTDFIQDGSKKFGHGSKSPGQMKFYFFHNCI